MAKWRMPATLLRTNHDLKVSRHLTFPEAVLEDLRRLREKGIAPPETDRFEASLATADPPGFP